MHILCKQQIQSSCIYTVHLTRSLNRQTRWLAPNRQNIITTRTPS
jgi:hypothetical protein